jgi:hypothetical protein
VSSLNDRAVDYLQPAEQSGPIPEIEAVLFDFSLFCQGTHGLQPMEELAAIAARSPAKRDCERNVTVPVSPV